MGSKDDHHDDYVKLYKKNEAASLLLEALKGDDKNVLEERIEDCKSAKVREENSTLERAQTTIRLVERLEGELDKAMDSEEYNKIDEAVLNIKASGTQRYLRHKIEEAERYLNENKKERFAMHTIGLSKTAMSEMRTYYNPSPLVRNVMSAALLLLDEDEEKTADWSYVVKNAFPAYLNRRVIELDAENVDDNIKSRAQYLLRKASLAKIRKSCPGVASFYVWTRDIVGGESEDEEEEEEEEDEEKLARMEEELKELTYKHVMAKSQNGKKDTKVEPDPAMKRLRRDISQLKDKIAEEQAAEKEALEASIKYEKKHFKEKEKKREKEKEKEREKEEKKKAQQKKKSRETDSSTPQSNGHKNKKNSKKKQVSGNNTVRNGKSA